MLTAMQYHQTDDQDFRNSPSIVKSVCGQQYISTQLMVRSSETGFIRV